LRTTDFQFLDLRPGGGNLLGPYWETNAPSLGEYWTLNTGASPNAAVESSLSQILQATVPQRYYLSRTACMGILRRAEERGKDLPPQLEAALERQAGIAKNATSSLPSRIDSHNVAGFCAGAGPSAGTIGYQEERAPTLKASASGNMMPSILCLNDQGGQRMDLSLDHTGTLRADEGISRWYTKTTGSMPDTPARTKSRPPCRPGMGPAATMSLWFHANRIPSASLAMPLTGSRKTAATVSAGRRIFPIP